MPTKSVFSYVTESEYIPVPSVSLFRGHFPDIAIFRSFGTEGKEEEEEYWIYEQEFQRCMMLEDKLHDPLHYKKGTFMTGYPGTEDPIYQTAVWTDLFLGNLNEFTVEEYGIDTERILAIRRKHGMIGHPVTVIRFSFIRHILDSLYQKCIDSIEEVFTYHLPSNRNPQYWFNYLSTRQTFNKLQYTFIETMIIYGYEGLYINYTERQALHEVLHSTASTRMHSKPITYKPFIAPPGRDVIDTWFEEIVSTRGKEETEGESTKKEEETGIVHILQARSKRS